MENDFSPLVYELRSLDLSQFLSLRHSKEELEVLRGNNLSYAVMTRIFFIVSAFYWHLYYFLNKLFQGYTTK